MGVGLQVWSDSGFLQIDSDYMNLGLLNVVTLYTATESSLEIEYRAYSVAWVKYTTQNKNSLLAIRCGEFTAPVRIIENTNNYTYLIAVDSPLNYPVVIYEFGEMSKLPTGNGSGFEVYTSSGQVAFSSGYRYMRVVDFIGSYEATTPPLTKTYKLNRQYAYILGAGAGYVDTWFDGNAHWQNFRWLLMAKTIQGGVFLNEVAIQDYVSTVPITGRYNYVYSVLIIDVTGY